MPIDNEKSRLNKVEKIPLIITQTLVGNGTEDSLARNVYQIWSEKGEQICTLDYKDAGYDAISASFYPH
ncbi:hypothetical protein VN96_1851 [Lactococcus cremoris]|uniref:hypothetical protein n=1 Tax=Lactococcus TaxID=1357 RepID=UPI00062A4B28|nr:MULTISPECIES: hypothetical protein [Lactococcus]KKW71866.1 hypothetical protein VN96_1851 [Lactococcus cremoris]MCT0474110.1 hypothetical protein [Lactococcus cremoris]MCT0511480.1 hypothetical protein [Lactococcus cremoris]WEA55151.1 hypothetical protein PWP91_12865 [Lactococcus lactis]